MLRRGGIFILLVLGILVVRSALAQDVPQLVDIIPGRVGDRITCRLKTRGLPGEKQLQTMRSGLESAVTFQLALLDEKDRPVASQSLSLRMGFDLWDEVFSVKNDGHERRFQSLDDLRNYLADLPEIPVVEVANLGRDSLYRVSVGLVVHTLAPDEQKRVEDVIVGAQRPRREGQDAQEASVSLGRLIRMFYKGGERTREGQGLLSAWFTAKDLAP